MSVPVSLEERIAALTAEGKNEEAADLCLSAGDPARASELLASVWKYERAVDVAERSGLLALAYKHALTARNREASARLMQALREHPDMAQAAAATALAVGRTADAARLIEWSGEVERAADIYKEAGEFFDAARCFESAGRYRDAGILYERRLREDRFDPEAALRLGRILAHFGRYEPAARALQTAAKDSERKASATRLLVACFSAMGLNEAAGSCLDDLRQGDPSLPMTVPQYLAANFGDDKGLAGLEHGVEQEQLLAGRYRILRPIGSGATGRVLLAYDGFHGRQVAVKVLTVGGGASGRDAYIRFAREARVAGAVDHPNVVRVFEFNPDGPFLVMEYMAGGTLEDRLNEARGGLSLPVVRQALLSVLAGLEAVHRRGVTHRDLKPANIFFGATGDVKIGDFGVAHLADLGTTMTGALLGTLAYMAPEQITGSHPPDASTDLYAIGVILHRMLTGRLPFEGPDFVTQHLSAAPKAPSTLVPELGQVYDPLLAALLAKRQDQRPASASALREWIERLPWEELVRDGSRPDSAGPPSAAGPSSIPAGPDQRYVEVERLRSEVVIARDEILDRAVILEECGDARAARLKRLSTADSPFLQAVYDVDVDRGRAVLEAPKGAPFMNESPERRAAASQQIRQAVRTMHETGVTHGAIDTDHVRIADGRAVLLLPDGTTGCDRQDDLDALSKLFPR